MHRLARRGPGQGGREIRRRTDRPAVVRDSPAEAAGLREGDIIVKVDSKPIDSDHPLDATLSEFAPGDTISVEVLRDGQTQTMSLTLAERPDL